MDLEDKKKLTLEITKMAITEPERLALGLAKILEDRYYKKPERAQIYNPGSASGLAELTMFNPESTEAVSRIAELEFALTQAKTQNLQLNLLKHHENIQEAVESGDLEMGDELDPDTRSRLRKAKLGIKDTSPESDLMKFDLSGAGAFESPLGKFIAGSLLYGVGKYLSRKIGKWLGRTAIGRAYRIPRNLVKRRYIHLMNSLRKSSRKLTRSAMKNSRVLRATYRTFNKTARKKVIARTKSKITKPFKKVSTRVTSRIVRTKPVQTALKVAKRAKIIQKTVSNIPKAIKRVAAKSLGKMAAKVAIKGRLSKISKTVLKKIPYVNGAFIAYDSIQLVKHLVKGEWTKAAQSVKDTFIDLTTFLDYLVPGTGTAISIALTAGDTYLGMKYTQDLVKNLSPIAEGLPIDLISKTKAVSQTEINEPIGLRWIWRSIMEFTKGLRDPKQLLMDLQSGKLGKSVMKFNGSDINFAYYLPSESSESFDEDVVAGYALKNGKLVKDAYDVPYFWRAMVSDNLEDEEFPMKSDLVYYKLSDIQKSDPELYDRLSVNIDNWVRLKQSGIDTDQLSVMEANPLSGTVRTAWGDKIVDGSTIMNGRVLIHTVDGLWMDSTWSCIDQNDVTELFNFSSESDSGFSEGGYTGKKSVTSLGNERVVQLYSISNMEKYNSNVRKIKKIRDRFQFVNSRRVAKRNSMLRKIEKLTGFSDLLKVIRTGIHGFISNVVKSIKSGFHKVIGFVGGIFKKITGKINLGNTDFLPNESEPDALTSGDPVKFAEAMYSMLYETLSNVDFIDARDISKWATLLTAQASLESTWGRSELSRKYYNFSGMTKGTAKYKGKSAVTMNNKAGNDLNTYAVFDSPADWAYDYVHYLHRKWDAFANGIEGFIGQLQNNPKHQGQSYATDSNYAEKISAQIDSVKNRLGNLRQELGSADVIPVSGRLMGVSHSKSPKLRMEVNTKNSITESMTHNVVLLNRNNSRNTRNRRIVNNYYEE